MPEHWYIAIDLKSFFCIGRVRSARSRPTWHESCGGGCRAHREDDMPCRVAVA